MSTFALIHGGGGTAWDWIEADEIDGGHYITLSRPRELAERLAAYAAGTR